MIIKSRLIKLVSLLNIFSLRKTSFRQQLALTFTVGIITLALLSSFAITRLTSHTLHQRLVEEGERITKELAIQNTLAILYESPENAEDASQAALSFPDIAGVAIYTKDNQVLFSSKDISMRSQAVSTLSDHAVIEFETNDNWQFIAPIFSSYESEEESLSPFAEQSSKAETIGYVRLLMSKETLHATTANILRGNLSVSAGLALILLLLLLFITRRLTRPLADLAKVMSLPAEGTYYVRAHIEGPKDVEHMQDAFNTMVDVLEGREELLKQVRDKALEAARLKGEFAANVTHELRTPMNGVLGMLELLTGTGLNDQQNEYVDIARGSADALLLLIDDILDFSKVEAGKSNFEIVDFDLYNLANDIVELLKIQAHSKDITLSYQIDDDVPPIIQAVSSRIRQVLINLLGNAIKFTEEGQVLLHIKQVKLGDHKGLCLQFNVHDTGIGIPENAQSSVFEAFSQVDGSSTRKYGGSGLGLAICNKLVNQMQGEMDMTSELGKGSHFWFSLPVKASSEAALIESDQAKPKESTALISRSLPTQVKQKIRSDSRILVVEDNRTNQLVASGMLERLACQAIIVDDGQQAVDMLMRESFDIILMDVHMPVMDGYTATRTIRDAEGDKKHTPIVAMTANVGQQDIDKCLSEGMDDFLGKPLKLDALRDKLLVYLGVDDNANADMRIESESYIETDASAAQDIEVDNKNQDLSSNDNKDIVIDRSILSELRKSVGHALEDMIDAFLEDLFPHIESIKDGLADDNAKAIEMAAHALKGSSRTFGADKFADQCKTIESMAKDSQFSEIKEILPQFELEAKRVDKFLANERKPNVDTRQSNVEEKHNGCVLIVDDQRDMRVAIRSALKEDGYELLEAASGEEALLLCERQTPDLILMDGLMPGIDGFTTCKELRSTSKYSHTPILMVTSLEDAKSIDAAFVAGANDYIPKPVNFGVLRKRIKRLLEASQAEQHVRQLAYHDPLTGLPNRTTFLKKLEKLVEDPKRDGKLLAVLFIDLDRFKLINDTLGHDVGDLLLKAAADRLLGSVRTTDLVARLGGDEFTIILESITSSENAAAIADKICKRMSESFVFMGQKMYVTTSIGISLFPIDGRDTVELLKHADTAMFRAKEQRDGYQFYEQGMETLIIKRVHMENELRHAIENDQLVLYYQPQKNLQTNKISGMEALVRWVHPERGMIPPFDFIPLAEETGLIISLGEWVLKRACQQLEEWLNKGYEPLRLSVNLSGRQIEHEGLIETVADIIQETNIPGKYLELEITESAMMKKPDNVISVLNELRNMDISLAIDDFGTGHSSLSYLRRFPVGTLKIDRSFVMDITTSKEDASIITGIIALAQSLNLLTIAEGVETIEQQTMLTEQGCDVMQGYYLDKPLPADEFEEKIYRQSDIDIEIPALSTVNANVEAASITNQHGA